MMSSAKGERDRFSSLNAVGLRAMEIVTVEGLRLYHRVCLEPHRADPRIGLRPTQRGRGREGVGVSWRLEALWAHLDARKRSYERWMSVYVNFWGLYTKGIT